MVMLLSTFVVSCSGRFAAKYKTTFSVHGFADSLTMLTMQKLEESARLS